MADYLTTPDENRLYGRPTNGTVESVAAINTDDMRSYLKRVLTRETLRIGVVGDIDPASAARLVDKAFSTLPMKSELAPIAEVSVHGVGKRIVIDLDVSQAVARYLSTTAR